MTPKSKRLFERIMKRELKAMGLPVKKVRIDLHKNKQPNDNTNRPRPSN